MTLAMTKSPSEASMTLQLFDINPTGEQLRDAGVAKVYKNHSAWVDKARSTAKAIAAWRGSVSIDEVLEACPRPESVHPNATGSIFREKCWKRVGYTQSKSPAAHARVVGVYELNGK